MFASLFTPVQKANPYHDEYGRFSDHTSAKHISSGGVFDRNQAGPALLAARARLSQKNSPPLADSQVDEAHRAWVVKQYNKPPGMWTPEELRYIESDDGKAEMFDNWKSELRDSHHYEAARDASGKLKVRATEFNMRTPLGKSEFCKAIAKQLGVPNKDLDFWPTTDDYQFELGGQQRYAGGTYHRAEGSTKAQIKVYLNQVQGQEQIARLISHEYEHHKYQVTGQATEDDDPEGFAVRSTTHSPENLKRLAKTDGVTAYSREWWANQKANPTDYYAASSAVNETLAEISTLSANEMKKVAPEWHRLHRGIRDMYDRLQRKRASP